jgi:hypothetical protein
MVPAIFCRQDGKRSAGYFIASLRAELMVVFARLRFFDAKIEPFAFVLKPVWAMNSHSGRCQFEAEIKSFHLSL